MLCYAHSFIGDNGARIGFSAFAELLTGSIWVVIGGALTVRLADVLGQKPAVDFPCHVALVTALYPHLRGGLRPRILIGPNIFFLWEWITCSCYRVQKRLEPRSDRNEGFCIFPITWHFGTNAAQLVDKGNDLIDCQIDGSGGGGSSSVIRPLDLDLDQ